MKRLFSMSLDCKLVAIQYREYEYSLLKELIASASLQKHSKDYSRCIFILIQLFDWVKFDFVTVTKKIDEGKKR